MPLLLWTCSSGSSSGVILGTGGCSLDWRSPWTFGGVPTCVARLGYIAIRVAGYGPTLAAKA